jgi:hypothetical protein
MKALLLILLACACVGCRSSTKVDAPSRSYVSANKQSWQFFWESMSEGTKLRKANLRTALNFSSRMAENNRIRKECLGFGWDSIFQDQFREAGNTWRAIGENLREDTSAMGASMRFGFLDSGD